MKLPRLIAVLNLLDSSSDGEALSAARTAARMVKASKRSWADLLGGAARPSDDVDVASEEMDLKTQITKAFKELGEKAVKQDPQLVDLLARFRDSYYLPPTDRAIVFDAVKRKRANAGK